MKPLVILHGWSDNSESFKPLATILQQQLQRPAMIINLADYLTLDDAVTYDDVVAAMMNAWQFNKLPLSPRSVDAVVHSTGGLVIRDWLSRNFIPELAPIENLVMLAPANFGSPLAHKGNAFFGRVLNGFTGDKIFQVGENLLKGLELASPYTWQLAMKDSFSSYLFYNKQNILCTILVGNTGYTGISAAANENGSDGTVRLATANLNCAWLSADFSIDPHKPTYKLTTSNNTIAFGIMDKENHRTIAGKEEGFQNPNTLKNILKGLTLNRDQFDEWCQTLAVDNVALQAKQQNYDYKHGFQNTVFSVYDQFNQRVEDYFIEFYANEEPVAGWFAGLFHQDIIETTHAYTDDNSYRSIYVDCTKLYQNLISNLPAMNISLTAYPVLQQEQYVGYRTFTDNDIGDIRLTQEQIKEVFVANRTLLVSIKLRREQASQLFTFTSLPNEK